MNEIDNPDDIARFIKADLADLFTSKRLELENYGLPDSEIANIIKEAKHELFFLLLGEYKEEGILITKREPHITNDLWVSYLNNSNSKNPTRK